MQALGSRGGARDSEGEAQDRGAWLRSPRWRRKVPGVRLGILRVRAAGSREGGPGSREAGSGSRGLAHDP